jgi:hypothetical protein
MHTEATTIERRGRITFIAGLSKASPSEQRHSIGQGQHVYGAGQETMCRIRCLQRGPGCSEQEDT